MKNDAILERMARPPMERRCIMYVINTDPARNLLRVDVRGFWDMATLERFKVDLPKAFAGLPGGIGSHLVLIDALQARPQSQEITAGLFAFLNNFEDKARRLTFVTNSAVLALQARRLFDRPGFSTVETVAEAEAYLFGEA
ncbi:MAG: hypothetical protein ABW169_05970 [Sphingobium sp.]